MSGVVGDRGRWIGVAGALLAAIAVGLGAFATHSLSAVLSEARLATLATGVQYQFFHGLGLLAVAALDRGSGRLRVSAALLFGGAVVFCGSLYLLVATGIGAFGATAPLGGAGMILGWVVLAVLLGRGQS